MNQQIQDQHRAPFKHGNWYMYYADGAVIPFSSQNQYEKSLEEDKAIKKDVYEQIGLDDSDEEEDYFIQMAKAISHIPKHRNHLLLLIEQDEEEKQEQILIREEEDIQIQQTEEPDTKEILLQGKS